MLREQLHHRHTGVSRGFRPRGTDVTRIEGFSDAVFAFALTLLVVSLEVPRTFGELMHAMRGFVAFAISFVFLLQIWFKHYGFFRRYGLQDVVTRLLNSALLFIVLFYVYPLKFLWTHLPFGGETAAFTPSEAKTLLVIYGLGGSAVFTIFALLHLHAWRLRDATCGHRRERADGGCSRGVRAAGDRPTPTARGPRGHVLFSVRAAHDLERDPRRTGAPSARAGTPAGSEARTRIARRMLPGITPPADARAA